MSNPLERLPQLRELLETNSRYHKTLLDAIHTLVECVATARIPLGESGQPLDDPKLMADIASFVEALVSNRVAGLGLSIEVEKAIQEMDLALVEELRRGSEEDPDKER
jgi:hypothetical protein